MIDALRPAASSDASEASAAALIAEAGEDAAEPWIAARDAAVLTLLYAAGLRISEALALKGRDHPLAESLRVTGKGGKTRIAPILAAARDEIVFARTEEPFRIVPGRGDEGNAAGQRLELHDAERVGQAREHEDVGGSEVRGQILALLLAEENRVGIFLFQRRPLRAAARWPACRPAW
jgi:hypothetical protein